MSRKSLATIVLLTLIASVSVAGAAEKVDNVFIAGVDGGYHGFTGWLGENFAGGVGGALFFGYGITNNFAIELDYLPMVTTDPTGDDVDTFMDAASFGGVGGEAGGFGGLGISGKLYPRERFRDADFVIVQPMLRMGLGYLPFYWDYKTDNATQTTYNEDFDGYSSMYLNLGGGLDFMLAKWVSIGLDVRIWKMFITGDTVNGYAADDDLFFKTDFEGSMMYSAGANLTFQW